jgi:predicted RNA-binding protein
LPNLAHAGPPDARSDSSPAATTAARTYWLDLFTGTTWQEFLQAGGEVSGFREGRWKTVQQMRVGDYLLCYLTGVSRFVGVLEVVSPAFQDSSPIWKDAVFPCRVKVKPVVTLTPETAVPVQQLRDQLSMFQNMRSPFAWTGNFRGSPARWKVADGEAVVRALLEAQQTPVVRAVEAAKLARRPKLLKAKVGSETVSVTVPDSEEAPEEAPAPVAHEAPAVSAPQDPIAPAPVGEAAPPDPPSAHEEVQWLLLRLGNDMGLDVWVARNDRGREVSGHRFTDLPRMKDELPLQFDEVTNRTIELIDVLWLRGNAIVAAFEIESTTSIYSGLLRMSDLIAMQPNLNIPLYLVAPEERRGKVMVEVNRPTFSRLSPPMRQMCRYISFSVLRKSLAQVAPVLRYLKPEFLEELSESCEMDEA